MRLVGPSSSGRLRARVYPTRPISRDRDGTVQTEILHVPHQDPTGRIVGLYTVVMDITARKLAEKVLSESEERFRSIADSAPVPMWVSRLDGLRQFVNRAYHEFLGVPYADALNFDWRKALHPDDLERILGEQRAGEGSLKPFALEARYRRHDGQWRWLRSESQPRWGPGGEHIGFIGVAHDITASKEAERALTELNETLERRIEDRTRQLAASEALIQTFFEHSSECHAVIVEESDGLFRYAEANPATLRLYGKTREEVIGRTIEAVLGAERAAEIGAHLAACLEAGAPHRYERTQGDAVIEAVVTPAPQEPGALAPRHCQRSRRDGAASSRTTTASISEDGSGWTADRRRRARFQQSPDPGDRWPGHHRSPDGELARSARSDPNGAGERYGDAGRKARRRH